MRIGHTPHVLLYAGHIGYEVLPEHRGHAYAYYACQALVPFAKQYYDAVILTVEVGNTPSVRTIEKLGAIWLGEIAVPCDDPSYKGGARRKVRFKWLLENLETP